VQKSIGSDLVFCSFFFGFGKNSKEKIVHPRRRLCKKSLVCFRFSLLFIESEEYTRRYVFLAAALLASCFVISRNVVVY
jgi:hypothetical protein